MDYPHSILIHSSDDYGTFEEFSYECSDATHLLLAPHGGQVEPNTDTQALLTAKFVENVTVWGTRGMVNGDYGDAYNRWHTTGQTHPLHTFPLYDKVQGENYITAISLHVMSEDGIIIGGRASEECRQSLQEYLNRYFPEETVRLASEGEARAGMNPKNFVNAANANHSLHIEQSVDIATRNPTKLADVISEWLNTTDFESF